MIIYIHKNINKKGCIIISTTRIIPIHKNKTKSIKQTILDTVNYVKNPDKTENETLISCYCCDLKTVDSEFALSKREYFELTGRSYNNDVIAYQLRQSFKPGEITPEEANAISYELAARLLKGKHAFIVATHTDKHHIHSHIIFNSTTLDCSRKFRNHYNSFKTVRELADLICNEHNLSVISDPGPASPSYDKWDGFKKKISNRDILKATIDDILSNNQPSTFDDFLTILNHQGYEIKEGKYVSVKGFNQQRFIRLNSLGIGYTEDNIQQIISSKHVKQMSEKDKPSMLIDIEKAMSEGKGIGYQNWAKVFNLKQMAKAFSYLQENNFTSYESLSNQITEESNTLSDLENQIESAQARIDEIKELKQHIINYSKYNSTYQDYKKCKKSVSYYNEHKQELELYKDAKKHFDSLNLDKKLPSIKELNEEFNNCLSKKKEAINLKYPLQNEHRKHLIYKENVRLLLNINDKTRMSEQKHEH